MTLQSFELIWPSYTSNWHNFPIIIFDRTFLCSYLTYFYPYQIWPSYTPIWYDLHIFRSDMIFQWSDLMSPFYTLIWYDLPIHRSKMNLIPISDITFKFSNWYDLPMFRSDMTFQRYDLICLSNTPIWYDLILRYDIIF